MEWIFYGLFGVLGLIVTTIIGLAGYTVFFGKAKDLPNLGPRVMGAEANRHNRPRLSRRTHNPKGG